MDRRDAVSVLIVDSQPIVRYGIRGALHAEANIVIVSEASSMAEALDQARVLEPDVILGEVVQEGVEDAVDAFAVASHARLIAFSSVDSWDCVQTFFRCGGMGYVTKSSPISHLVEAVRAVADGRQYVSPHIREPLRAMDEQGSTDDGTLSHREREILSLIADGLTSAEIGDLLCISRRTVETHRYRMCRKLSANSRSQLVRYAQSHGLVRST